MSQKQVHYIQGVKINYLAKRSQGSLCIKSFIAFMSFVVATGCVTTEEFNKPKSANDSLKASPQLQIAKPMVLNLPPPEFNRPRNPMPHTGKVWLRKIKSEPNKIIDIQEWLNDNHLTQPKSQFTLTNASIIIGQEYIVELDEYAYAPRTVSNMRYLSDQKVRHSELVGGTLYFSNNHMGYAKTTGGQNGYITALDLDSGKVLWRSAPLVSNAVNFIVHGEYIISGYGFTDEPDYLYIIDRRTGDLVDQIKVKSQARILVKKENKLYVRAYNTNYVFKVEW
ncbi:hypothetical protein N9D31_03070 [Oligoflexaceae bacterium]|nr:hypothetical protein [Oligoflexaceae bacterium]